MYELWAGQPRSKTSIVGAGLPPFRGALERSIAVFSTGGEESYDLKRKEIGVSLRDARPDSGIARKIVQSRTTTVLWPFSMARPSKW